MGQIDYSDRYSGVSGNTSANLGDYTLSFDAKAKAPFAYPGFWLVISGDSSDFLALTDPTSYQHFTLNLGSDLIGSSFDPRSTMWQLDFNIESSYFGDPAVGDQLILSNIKLTMVPEPSSLVLALPLAGSAARAFLRRRKGISARG